MIGQRRRDVGLAARTLVWLAGGLAATAELKLPGAISDHMVLQRDRPVPVWGTAAPGEAVTVSFAGQEKRTAAQPDGTWRVTLDPLPASAESRELTVTGGAGSAPLRIADVLVGEVWIGSGQSNMAGGTGQYAGGDPTLAEALAAAPYPALRILKIANNGKWAASDGASLRGFSALLFAFGLRLHKELGVPVGLMVGAVGGTPSGLWLSADMFNADPRCRELNAAYAPTYAKLMQKYETEQIPRWTNEVAAAKAANKAPPRQPDPPAKPGETSRGKIGGLYAIHVQPAVPYAIRGALWDQGESGTAIGGVDQYTLMGALIAGWRKAWGLGDFPFIYVQKPSGGGCAWEPTNAVNCRAEAFAALPARVPDDGAYLENHIRIRNFPQTGMAISSDLGPGVHPVNKSGYGHRAADVALGMVYGKPVEYYGPVYASHAAEGAKLRVRFTHVGRGLASCRGDRLQGFAIAGEDRRFRWADAVIDGDTVVLSCAGVPQPRHVRYAWASRRPWANLFNKDGLPAIPFRTDG